MSEEITIGARGGLEILCASAVRAALTDCAESFVRASGGGVTLRFDTSGAVAKRAAAGEPAGIFASSLDSIGDIAAAGFAVPPPLVLGSSRLALGLRAGEPAPDISTPEKFRAVLLAAKSIARGDPAGGGTAGNYLRDLFETHGLTQALSAKSILRAGGYKVMREVAEHRADFGLTQSTEIAAVAGVEIGAWLPDEWQLATLYALAPSSGGTGQKTAQAFVAHVAGGQGRAAFARAGFAPP